MTARRLPYLGTRSSTGDTAHGGSPRIPLRLWAVLIVLCLLAACGGGGDAGDDPADAEARCRAELVGPFIRPDPCDQQYSPQTPPPRTPPCDTQPELCK